MSWELIIPGIAAGLSLTSLFFRYLTHDREKMKAVEFAVIRKQREVKRYQKEKDTEKMMKAQKEMMSLSMSKMKTSFKSTIFTFPLFILVWWVILGPMLSVGPLVAGEVSQVGVDLRNLGSSQQDTIVTLVSHDIEVTGNASVEVQLDDFGDDGDRQQLWWNVTAPQGPAEYTIEVYSKTKDARDNVTYPVTFVSPASLTTDFSPKTTEKILDGSYEMAPLYHPKRMNLFGFVLDWNWYYIISFFIFTPLLYPLTNKLLWGHWKGVKHLEKLDRLKNGQRSGQKNEGQ